MESENYVYKKEVDWSTLMEGFTLPLDNQVIFLRNMESFLQRGESKIIHFFMNGKTYDAKIVNVNNSVRISNQVYKKWKSVSGTSTIFF